MDNLRTLEKNEVAELFHCNENQVDMWRESGILKAIRTGKSFVYPQSEIQRFIDEYTGCDISNRLKIMDLLRERAYKNGSMGRNSTKD